ncbi:30S ribosomal protein S27ae [Candidatus Micrarchaeota archaeon]|nr:30S ribosomal protein S27ae [Candidatus Micrarchaeota archaeon]
MAEKAKSKKPSKYEPRKNCPKCGPGFHLAEHKNRRTCGKCAYMETKTAEVKA